MKVKISVVIPMYNEQENVLEVISRVSEQLNDPNIEYELVCVNDGSTDDTFAILKRASQTDSRIIPIDLSRNFGKEAALSAGLGIAAGDAVIIIDADMQHPPELIPQMLNKWREGNDVVECRKAKRSKESLIYKTFAWTFYSIIGTTTDMDLRGSSDY